MMIFLLGSRLFKERLGNCFASIKFTSLMESVRSRGDFCYINLIPAKIKGKMVVFQSETGAKIRDYIFVPAKFKNNKFLLTD